VGNYKMDNKNIQNNLGQLKRQTANLHIHTQGSFRLVRLIVLSLVKWPDSVDVFTLVPWDEGQARGLFPFTAVTPRDSRQQQFLLLASFMMPETTVIRFNCILVIFKL